MKDYRTMVNPTFITAKTTIYMLAVTGNEDAKKMIAGLNLQETLTILERENSPIPEADRQALMAGAVTAVEARYAAVSRLLKSREWNGLLDIACGYTPRAFFCKKAGIGYAGLDVPVVAEELQRFADQEGLGKVYTGGDATNAASLLAAAEKLEGKILVSCEGLLGYLSEDEFEQLLGGIRQVLKLHGGAWVSSDMGVDYEAFTTANMESADAAALYNAARRKAMDQSNIYNKGVARWDPDRMKDYLESHGLKVEKLPFWDRSEGLSILRTVPEAWAEKYEQLLKNSCVWKMTLDEKYEEHGRIAGAKQVENLKISYEVDFRTLNCAVTGRIDTISSPALLEVFERTTR